MEAWNRMVRYIAGFLCLLAWLMRPVPCEARQVVSFLCLPHLEPPRETLPSDEEILKWKEEHPQVENTFEELQRDREFARQVMGHQWIFQAIATFEATHTDIEVHLRFLDPAEWFDQLKKAAEYGTAPFVCIVGDTWVEYFQQLGVVDLARRYYHDWRLLWFWRDKVSAKDVADGETFYATALRLRSQGIIPLAIPTHRDWDLLWNFYVWHLNAGGDIVGVYWWRWGKKAILNNEAGKRTIHFLIRLAEADCLALPEVSNLEVTQDFLEGNYAMIVMEPWVAWQAEKKWGPEWTQRIGWTLPPSLGGERTTFLGGTMLVLMDPTQGQAPASLKAAREWLVYLRSSEVQSRQMEILQFVPGSPKAWGSLRFQTVFQEALQQGSAPPCFPEWPLAVEQPAVLDQFYWFWKRLAILPRMGSKVPQRYRKYQRKMLEQTLQDVAHLIDEQLTPGWWKRSKWWVEGIILLIMGFGGFSLWQRYRAKQREREMVERVKELKKQLEDIQRQRWVIQMCLQRWPSLGSSARSPAPEMKPYSE